MRAKLATFVKTEKDNSLLYKVFNVFGTFWDVSNFSAAFSFFHHFSSKQRALDGPTGSE